MKATKMYKTEINGNVLICDYYYKKSIREQNQRAKTKSPFSFP